MTIGQCNNKKGRATSVIVKQQITDARRTSISSSTADGVFAETFSPGSFGNLNMSVTIERDINLWQVAHTSISSSTADGAFGEMLSPGSFGNCIYGGLFIMRCCCPVFRATSF